jgi:hypothetical protein
MPNRWTSEDVRAAWRDAIAIAQAAHSDDREGVGHVWNTTAKQDVLVWCLARLPRELLLFAGSRTVDATLKRFYDTEPTIVGSSENEED